MTLLCGSNFPMPPLVASPMIAKSFTWIDEENCRTHSHTLDQMFSVPIWTWGSWKMLFTHGFLGSSWHGIGDFILQVLIDALMIYHSFYPFKLFMIHTPPAMKSCKAHISSRLECLQIFLYQFLTVLTTPNNIIEIIAETKSSEIWSTEWELLPVCWTEPDLLSLLLSLSISYVERKATSPMMMHGSTAYSIGQLGSYFMLVNIHRCFCLLFLGSIFKSMPHLQSGQDKVLQAASNHTWPQWKAL